MATLPLMIVVHNEAELAGMRRAGRVAAATLETVVGRIDVGTRGVDIDRWVRDDTRRRRATPSQLGYHGFPAAVCVSPNAVVCHGIPDERPLVAGDIVNVDVTSKFEGFHGDTSVTVAIGEISAQRRALISATQDCLEVGIAAVADGVRLGDIGAAIDARARAHGFRVVTAYGGHGIGREMHMPPHVHHTGRAGTGLRLRAGMCLTIEPILCIGQPKLRELDDGWTVMTADGTPTAQFEHTLAVTATGAEVLTRAPA